MFVRDYERAVEQASKTLEMFPDSLLTWWVLGLAQMCRSRYSEAIAALERAVAISDDAMSITYLGCAQARAGRVDLALSTVQNLLSRSSREHVPPRCFVFLYAAISDQDRALEWLEKAHDASDSGLFWLRVMPLYDPLRTTPRFKEMLHRVGLPPD